MKRVIPRFREFRHMDDSRLVVETIDYIPSESDVVRQEDSVINLIFAPDPDTGVPRSDLALMFSKDKSPEIAQYIQDTLMRPVNDGSGAPDADTALEFMCSRSERVEDYANRLREIVSKE